MKEGKKEGGRGRREGRKKKRKRKRERRKRRACPCSVSVHLYVRSWCPLQTSPPRMAWVFPLFLAVDFTGGPILNVSILLGFFPSNVFKSLLQRPRLPL